MDLKELEEKSLKKQKEIKKLEEELEKLSEKIKELKNKENHETADFLLNKYKKNLIEVGDLRKKQETILKKIHKENYNKHSICEECHEMTTWEDVVCLLCPLGFACGYIEDGFDEIIENDYGNKTNKEFFDEYKIKEVK